VMCVLCRLVQIHSMAAPVRGDDSSRKCIHSGARRCMFDLSDPKEIPIERDDVGRSARTSPRLRCGPLDVA